LNNTKFLTSFVTAIND